MSTATAHAFWIMAPGHGEIRAHRLRRPESGEALVRTLYSGISRGTETLVFNGHVPPGEYARMRAPFQEGEFPGPVKYGYINVGVVESGPAELLNRAVFSLFPHQTLFVAPTDALHAVPRAVPPERAVLAANLETAINALWDARLARGGRITIIGAGALGCLCGWLARHHYAADVELVDIDDERAAIAQRLGLAFAKPEQARADVPLIVHASATEAGLRTALRLAGFEAVIVELSWFGDRAVSLPLGEAFHSRRLTLRASQVGHVAAGMRGHATGRSRLQAALRALVDARLDALIDSCSRFEELPQVFRELADGSRRPICHRVEYPKRGV